MADCLFNPALSRNVGNARDIGQQGKKVFRAATLCGGGDKHPRLPCLQSDSDCRNMNAGEGDLLDSLRGGLNPRARCGVVVFHTGDKVERGRISVKGFFSIGFKWGEGGEC